MAVGEGRTNCGEPGIIEIPNEMYCSNPDDVINHVYDDFDNNVGNHDYYAKRAILTTKNKTVDDINGNLLKKHPGEERVFTSVDSVNDDEATLAPVEFLNTLEISGLPPHKLVLKVNSPMM